MEYSDRIKKELVSIDKEKTLIALVGKKEKIQVLDELELRGAALTLSTIYNGIEKVLILVLESRRIDVIQDRDWHTRVLKIAKEEKIISSDLSDELVSYLGFRHFIRHSYSFQINRKSVAEIINKVPRLIDRFIEEIKFGSLSS